MTGSLRERIARRMCARHSTGGTVALCQVGYDAADAAIAVLADGLSRDDWAEIRSVAETTQVGVVTQ